MLFSHAKFDVTLGPFPPRPIRNASSAPALENPEGNDHFVISFQPSPHPGMSSAPHRPQGVEQPSSKISGRCVCRGNFSSPPAPGSPVVNGLAEKPRQLSSHPGMSFAPPGVQWVEQSVHSISGGCICGGNFSALPVSNIPTKEPRLLPYFLSLSFDCSPISDLPSISEQPLRIRGGCCPGGGLCGVGANKDKDDDRLEAEQQQRREQMAEKSRSTGGSQPLPVLTPPAQAAIREHKPSKASKRTASLPGEPPQAGSQPKASQSNSGKRLPAKTLPPHLAPPDLPQSSKKGGGGRTQSMGPRTARPSLP